MSIKYSSRTINNSSNEVDINNVSNTSNNDIVNSKNITEFFFQNNNKCESQLITKKILKKSNSDRVITTLYSNIGDINFYNTKTKQREKQQLQQLQQGIKSLAVVQQRSWRTHYTRPNKSLEHGISQSKMVSYLNK